jgi:hypothetical protein
MPKNVGTALIKNNATITFKTGNVGGNKVVFSSSQTPTSGSMTVPASGGAVKTGNNNTSTGPVPLKARAGTTYTDATLYNNSPIIDIVSFSGTGGVAGVLNTFTNFIMTDIQEQMSEKVDVIETFGLPHLFASGRFMRRFTFQGYVRTTAVNYQSSNVIYHTPASTQLRYFYENYMRASIQAEKQWYTRVTADKEVYEGFIHTFNLMRNSQQDTTEQFVFSMVAFKQHNPTYDNDVKSLLAITGYGNTDPDTSSAVAEQPPTTPGSVATFGPGSDLANVDQPGSELANDDQPGSELANDDQPGSDLDNANQPGSDLDNANQPGSDLDNANQPNNATEQGFGSGWISFHDLVQSEVRSVSAKPPISLSSPTLNAGTVYYGQQATTRSLQPILLTGNSEQLLVSSVYPGVDLVYVSNTQSAIAPVNGSIASSSVSCAVTYRITNYLALYNALIINAPQAISTPVLSQPGQVTGVVPVVISTQSGKSVVLNIKITLNPPGAPAPVVSSSAVIAGPINSEFNKLTFVQSLWQPVLSVPDQKTGQPTGLDRLGFLEFLLTTATGQQPSAAALAALALGTLSFATSFSSDVGTMNMGPVPLAGNKANGTGRIGDVLLQTTLFSSTQTQNGLQLLIQLCAIHTPNGAAKYYNVTFWNYLCTVIRASITAPGLAALAPWRK